MPLFHEGNELIVVTHTQKARFIHGSLVSLRSAVTNREMLGSPTQAQSPPESPLTLIYDNNERVPVIKPFFGNVYHLMLSDTCCEIRFEGWEADGLLKIRCDEATGDISIEPSAYANRSGISGVRFTINGVSEDLEVVAPFYQGARADMNSTFLAGTTWQWPSEWEAALSVFQAKDGDEGFSVWCEDVTSKYKKISFGNSPARKVEFESCAYGPWDNNKAAGGLTWKLNIHQGSWETPVKSYRNWLQKAYNLNQAKQCRPSWVDNVQFAISWCPTDIEILDALAQKLDPRTVLLHLPNWREDIYDQNYPRYTASSKGAAFMAKARHMGFHVMPHANANQVDPSHPSFDLFRDFQYEYPDNRRIHGWVWWPKASEGADLGVFSVPQSYSQLKRHRSKNVIISVHPGLSMWRHTLAEQAICTVKEHGLDSFFIDVTLTTWNLRNSLVEGMTATEGMGKLIAELSEIAGGIAIGGEGLNEITMQRQSFAQAHLFRSHQATMPGLLDVAYPVNALLFEGMCRTFGYSGLSGTSEESELRMRVHTLQGAIPTVTIGSASEIANPNKAVKEALDRAICR